jgi:hypothetical protein
MEPGRVSGFILAERVLLVLILAGLGLQVGYLEAAWPNLPSLVPTHFDWSGHADTWSRKSHLISLVGVPALIVFFLLGVKAGIQKFGLQRGGGVPTDRLLGPFLLALALGIVLLFGWIELRSIQVAWNQAEGLGKGYVWAVFGLCAASAPLLLVLLRWRKRLDNARPTGGGEAGEGG